MLMNQSMVIGPKRKPTLPVPRCWIENRPMRRATVMGTMAWSRPGAATFRPSTADSTEMAGVIMPSPNRNEVPSRASTTMPKLHLLIALPARTGPGKPSASRASMPPSPSLSARMTTDRYLPEIRQSRDQMIRERMPMTLAGVGSTAPMPPWPDKASRSA